MLLFADSPLFRELGVKKHITRVDYAARRGGTEGAALWRRFCVLRQRTATHRCSLTRPVYLGAAKDAVCLPVVPHSCKPGTSGSCSGTSASPHHGLHTARFVSFHAVGHFLNLLARRPRFPRRHGQQHVPARPACCCRHCCSRC